MLEPPTPTPQFLIISLIIAVFQLWMLVDAVRRRSPFYWIVAIFLLPLAAIFYFFRTKLPELTGRRPAPALAPRGPSPGPVHAPGR